MTQDIRIAHHGPAGGEAVTRRAALEDKDQAEGFGARALAVLFIGFAVYLKSFFTTSQAEDTGALKDQFGPAATEADALAEASAAAEVGMAGQEVAPKKGDPAAETPGVAQEAETGPPPLVALTLPQVAGVAAGAAIPDNPGTGAIGRDPSLADAATGGADAEPQAAEAAREPGGSLASGGVPGAAAGPESTGGETGAPPETDAVDAMPDAAGLYDIASLFQDLGTTLHPRPDSLVDRVTDLAIGDLMRDLTLEEFRAHLGPVPQDPGRPLETLVSVLTDAGSREAFLTRTGLSGLEADAAAMSEGFDPFHHTGHHSGAEPEPGPDLFI
ncbi:MAG: hypothetical protein LPK02_01225 [Rhodobacterales bacterium]|nr:hypothetical protein [Rhodobacterales bacterium]MDX5411654.1 hypothetical protein [Rhodobacterales bacterium]